jgi:predicted nucleic acid-binding protein
MARPSVPRVYADSALFYNVIKREPDLWPASLKVFLAAERGDVTLVASTLVLAEVTGWRGDIDELERDAFVLRYLEQESVEWAEVDLFVARDAGRFARSHHLRGADAIHLATAVRRKCHYFMSRDRAFPYGKTVSGVAVTEPKLVWNMTVDDAQVDAEYDDEVRLLETARKEESERTAALERAEKTSEQSAGAPSNAGAKGELTREAMARITSKPKELSTGKPSQAKASEGG